MPRVVRFALWAVVSGALCLFLSATPLSANCGSPIAVQQGDLGSRLGPGCGSTPFTAFWALGHGDPALTGGPNTLTNIDSGGAPGFLELDPGDGSLSYVGNWGEPGVDGCVQDLAVDVDLPPIGVLINDAKLEGDSNHVGTLLAFSNDFSQLGQFYVLDFSLKADPFDGLLETVDCADIPTPTITNIVGAGGGTFDVTASWADISTPDDCATNPDSDCFGAGPRVIKTGFQLYSSQAQCTVGPLTGDRDFWAPTGGQVGGLSATVNVPDGTGGNCQFLAMAPVFDSGFTVQFLSGTATGSPDIKPIGGQGDADGDGLIDLIDTCPFPGQPANPSNLDNDGDGLGNECDICPDARNQDQADGDSDGLGDACDPCPGDSDNDSDGDGFCAGSGFAAPKVGDNDNCPAAANADQADADLDGLGDVCDPCPVDAGPDPDGDGVCTSVDNCPAVANADQTDSDGDNAGDACDPCPSDAGNDSDADGVCSGAGFNAPKVDDNDNCPRIANPLQTPSGIGDGRGDACEDKFASAQVFPSRGGGFIRFRTRPEWNCPEFQVVRRDSKGDVVLATFPCVICFSGIDQLSPFYGGTTGAPISSIHGGRNIFVKAVRTPGTVCGGEVLPEAIGNASPEIQATLVR